MDFTPVKSEQTSASRTAADYPDGVRVRIEQNGEMLEQWVPGGWQVTMPIRPPHGGTDSPGPNFAWPNLFGQAKFGPCKSVPPCGGRECAIVTCSHRAGVAPAFSPFVEMQRARHPGKSAACAMRMFAPISLA